LTQEELIQNCIFLLNAGHETTTSLVGKSVGLLMDHPAGHQRLIEASDLITTAVEEVLRVGKPLQWCLTIRIGSISGGGLIRISPLSPGSMSDWARPWRGIAIGKLVSSGFRSLPEQGSAQRLFLARLRGYTAFPVQV